MTTSFIFSAIIMIAGVLFIIISTPFIRRKVKMNNLYGVRTEDSFASEQNWYAINEFGGRKLLQVGFMWVGGALVIMFVPYLLAVAALVLFLAIMLWQMAIVPIQQYAESLRNNSAK